MIIYTDKHGRDVYDVTEEVAEHWMYSATVRAERRGADVLILQKHKEWLKAIDGVRAKHTLTYNWLTHEGADLVEVAGTDHMITGRPDPKKPLFEQFNLY